MESTAPEEYEDVQEQASQLSQGSLDVDQPQVETIGASAQTEIQIAQDSDPKQYLSFTQETEISEITQEMSLSDTRSQITSKVKSKELENQQQQQQSEDNFSDDNPSDEMPWRGHDHVFAIFSSAGKPIFSSIGDETSIARITAILSAIMANFEARGESVQYVKGGKHTVVFVDKECFQLVVASGLGEPPEILKLQLELLHGQIVSLVTNAVEKMYERNPAYDVRTLLKGTTELLKTLLNGFAYSPAYFLAAYEPLLISRHVLEDLTTWLKKAAKSADAMHALLLAGDQIVAKIDTKQSMHPSDVLLLSNFVQANDSFRHNHLQQQQQLYTNSSNNVSNNINGEIVSNGEATSSLQRAQSGIESYTSYSPVCLPHFNPNIFLHAYIYFLDHFLGISIVMISGSQDSFYSMDDSRKTLQQQLQQSGYLRLIQECTASAERRYIQIETLPVSVGGGPSTSTPLLHFIFRRTIRRQFYQAVPLIQEMRTDSMRKKLVSFYGKMFTLLRQGNLREVWWSENQWSVLAIQDDSMDEIYALFDRCVLKGDAIRYATALLSYMKTTTEAQ